MTYEDFNRLSKIMPKEDGMDLPVQVFSKLTCSYLAELSRILPKDDYNDLATRIFKISTERIRRKDKTKIKSKSVLCFMIRQHGAAMIYTISSRRINILSRLFFFV